MTQNDTLESSLPLQRTLSLLKPDATRRNLTGRINARIETAGLRIIAQRRLTLTHDQAAAFYHEHKDLSFFGDLCTTMSSAPIVAQVLEGSEGIVRYRTLMGATNPSVAEENTLRREFGLSIEENTVHGSDGDAAAEREICFFFSKLDLFP